MALTMMIPGRRRDKANLECAQEARDWLLTLTSGRATQADAEAFRAWLRAAPGREAAFAEQQQLWSQLGPALQAETAAAGLSPRGGAMTGRRAFLGGAVAASATWLALRPPLGLWPGVGELGADYRTAPGEQRRIALGNAVEVEMNTQTRINILARTGSAGEIELEEGEARIQAGEAEARVRAGAGSVSARAAVFNLRYIDGEARLCCLAGTLRLTHGQGVFDVVAGRELRYDSQHVQPPALVDIEAVTAWSRGWLIFDRQPLSEVVRELNRYRRGRLVLVNAQLGRRLVQARFSLEQVADAEQLIRDSYGARITHLPAGVVLLS